MSTFGTIGSVGAFAVVAAGLSAACLDKQSSRLECGEGGDAFAFSGTDYCIYAGAIIIEGFDCPEAVPFAHEMDGLVICGPTESPPAEGWEELVVAWEREGNERPGDTAEPDVVEGETLAPETFAPETVEPETVEPETVGDTGPDATPGVCFEGLVPGECWVDSQCPAQWRCEGSFTVCTPCVDCPEMVSARRGSCRPADGADALGLVAWPADDGGDRPLAYWWIASAVYTQLDCPSFSIEIQEGDGYRAGPDEDGCSGVVFPQSATTLVRPGPVIADRPAVVRARGRYLTECFSSEPSGCGGSVELVSDDVELRAP